MLDDFELLREYVEKGADDAFRQLVERHSGMVHATAFRMVGDDDRAQEVTQAVFIILVRKAAKIRRSTVIGGWLYRTARFVSLELLRAEKRRKQHHEEYAHRQELDATTGGIWSQIAPVLDELIGQLREADRNVVILRLLEGKPFAEVGAALGISEASAKMRVARALEKLRSAFARRGVALPTGVLLATVSSHSALATPAGLPQTIAATALAGESSTQPSVLALVKGAVKKMFWVQFKVSAAGAGALGMLLMGIGVGVHDSGKSIVVPNLGPLAGEWEGTYESRVGREGTFLSQKAVLSIRAVPGGRSCDVQMTVREATGGEQTYHFTHTLNSSGTGITTVDDPQIARLEGEGRITEYFSDSTKGSLRLAFNARNANPAAQSHVRWIVDNQDQLLIDRHDQVPQQSFEFYSRLKLHRRASVTGAESGPRDPANLSNNP